MNERIQELAEQADEYAKQTVHYYMGQFDGLTWENRSKQARDTKFAELIVRECLNQCYNRGMNDELYNGQLKAAAYIEQHFGVEEQEKVVLKCSVCGTTEKVKYLGGYQAYLCDSVDCIPF